MDEEKYQGLKLENQLCFPLYVCSKEIIRRYRPFLDELDLTYTQYIAMMVFWDVKSISVKDLGKKLYLDSGTLTPVLKSLENKGYIVRRRLSTDERVVMTEITEKGEFLKEKAVKIPANIAGCVSLSGEEALTLYGLLYKILGGLSCGDAEIKI